MLAVISCLLLNIFLALITLRLTLPSLCKAIYLVSIGELFLLIFYITDTLALELLSIIILQSCWLLALYHKCQENTEQKNKINCLDKSLQHQTNLFQEIKTIALCDSLTSIANRRNFDMLLKTELNRSSLEASPLSLIIFDIDDFKAYNDTFGHLNGDKLLAAIGSLLKAKISVDICPARYGGEEFAIIMTNTTLTSALLFAEQLRSEIQLIHLTGETTVTASFGIASYEPAELIQVPDAEKIISVADKSLYRAKCQGKNRVIGTNIF